MTSEQFFELLNKDFADINFEYKYYDKQDQNWEPEGMQKCAGLSFFQEFFCHCRSPQAEFYLNYEIKIRYRYGPALTLDFNAQKDSFELIGVLDYGYQSNLKEYLKASENINKLIRTFIGEDNDK
jgi:hypothetical protein